jgi:DNA end-binding protein Ku
MKARGRGDSRGAPARRALWTGSITIGLIQIPVRVHPMVRKGTIPFRLLHRADGQPVRYERVCAKDGAVVPWSDIVKGYEVRHDEYVVFSNEELEAAKPESDRFIRLDKFVYYHAMDPVYFDTPYILLPERSEEAYGLLLATFDTMGRAGVGTVTMRTREYPVLIHAYKGALVMTTLRYAEEVTVPSAFDELSRLPVLKEEELDLAKKIIGDLSGDFDIHEYHDRYSERIQGIIKRKMAGETVIIEKPKGEEVRALMDALRDTLEQMKPQ